MVEEEEGDVSIVLETSLFFRFVMHKPRPDILVLFPLRMFSALWGPQGRQALVARGSADTIRRETRIFSNGTADLLWEECV